MEVPGALSLMEALGFRAVEVKGLPYLTLDDSHYTQPSLSPQHSRLTKAIRLLLEYQERQVEEERRSTTDGAAQGPRVRCSGGCGYWGDPSQGGLCSICYKAKHIGPAAVKALTGIAAVGGAKKCLRGCGHFAGDKFAGLCSQCHAKEGGAQQQSTSSTSTPTPKTRRQRLHSVMTKLHAIHLFGLGKQEEQLNKVHHRHIPSTTQAAQH